MTAGAPARGALAPIFLVVLVDVLSLTIMIPLLPFYASAFGASPVTVGALFAVFSACQLVSGPVLGSLSDRYGRRPLLLVSQAGMLASLVVLALADSMWMLFAGRIVSGLTAGNLTIAQAYITDRTPPQDRTRAFGIIGIAFGFGFAIGPAIAGVLAAHPAGAGHQEVIAALARPLLLAAALSGVSILATVLLLKEDAPPGAPPPDAAGAPAGRRLSVLQWRSYAPYFHRPELAPLLAQFLVFSLAFAVFIGGFALFAAARFTWDGHAFGADEVGYLYAYAGVLGIVVQGGLLRPLVRRHGEVPLIAAGFALTAGGYLVLGLAGDVTLLVVATTITSFGNGFLRPALTARVTHAVARHEQGVVLGLTQSIYALAGVVGPPLGNLLVQEHQLFLWAAVAGAMSAAGLLWMRRVRGASLPDPTGPG